MFTQEQIQAHNNEQRQAIQDRFVPLEGENLSKSEESTTGAPMYWTAEQLDSFKDNLFKSIDAGTISDEDLEKAESDIQSLTKTTMDIDGVSTEVFVKA